MIFATFLVSFMVVSVRMHPFLAVPRSNVIVTLLSYVISEHVVTSYVWAAFGCVQAACVTDVSIKH